MRIVPGVTKPRRPGPSLLVAAVPGVLLALVGVRAVVAEAHAADERAREGARAAAARLARSVDTLAAEYAAALPAAGVRVTRYEVLQALVPFFPHWAIDAQGRAVDVAGPVPESASGGAQDDRAPNEAAARDEAVTVLDRLAREQFPAIDMANLLRALSANMREPGVAATLDVHAAVQAARGGDTALALEAAAAAVDRARESTTAEAGAAAADAVELSLELLRDAGEPPPPWLGAAFALIAVDPWGLPSERRTRLLDTMEVETSAVTGPQLRAHRAAWDRARAAARDGVDGAAAFATAGAIAPLVDRGASVDGRPAIVAHEIPATSGGIALVVDREVLLDGLPTVVGGEVPAAVVTERIVREAGALTREADVVALRLVAPDGTRAVGSAATPLPPQVFAETAALAPPLAGWRAEALAAPASGVPLSALLLAAALVLATAAMFGGIVALRRAADRQARLAEDRRVFLDHVAHEVRTPAAALLALSEELASGRVPAEREIAYREHLLRESQRLARLVDDTLDLARVDAGRLVFRRERLDLRAVVRDAVAQTDAPTRVDPVLPETAIPVDADAAALQRTVRNLVDNALRHGGDATRVRVAVGRGAGTAVVAVTDRGPGIAPEHLPHLFERFYRVPSAEDTGRGVGLGLALCREVARAHGGDVDVTSERGVGSTFTLRLPLAGGNA